MLKPQDVVILLKLHSMADPGWTYQQVATELSLGTATVHEGLVRAATARLYDPMRKEPIIGALYEFLVHGLKYVFPAVRGATVRGFPTGFAAPVMVDLGIPPPTSPPVWAWSEGTVRGYSLAPFYKYQSRAAEHDPRLYRLLALVDAIRDGTARERELAIQLLKCELGIDANR